MTTKLRIHLYQPNWQANFCLKLYPKAELHTRGKWLVKDTKHRKDNQLQNHLTNESHKCERPYWPVANERATRTDSQMCYMFFEH